MTRTLLPLAEQPTGDLCVARVPLFQGLSHAEQLGVAALARPRTLARGEVVSAPTDAASQLLVVHTGSVKITRTEANGHEHLVRVLGPGDFVGETAFLTGRPPNHRATAIDPGQLCVFRHEDLDRLVRAHPSIGLRMLQAVSGRLQETESRLVSVISGDVSSRLAEYLLSLPGTTSDGETTVRLPLPKKDVAALLDTTPESLSRQLRRLRDSGVIRSRGARDLMVTDVDALMELADGA